MLHVRLRRSAALVGFSIILMEFGFSLYNVVWVHRYWHSLRGGTALEHLSPSQNIIFHLPAALLALASLLGGVVLYRATRDRSRWSWYAAVLAPLAAFLVIYKPPLTYLWSFDANQVILPWVAPLIWTRGSGNVAVSIGLQIAPYLAAVAYILAIALVMPHRRPSEGIRVAVPTRGSSAL